MARKQKPVSTALSPEVVQRLDRYVRDPRHRFGPSKREVLELALTTYLDHAEEELDVRHGQD
jgi:hypothetical protein